MELLPAIDLREGRVVRLERGDDRRRTVYAGSPQEVARRYAAAGVKRIHVVDLDAAFGEAPQRALVERLLGDAPDLRVQLGGGLRDREAIEWAFAAGCDRVVVTSLLVKSFALFAELAQRYPRRLVAALDVDRARLRFAGWRESASGSVADLCQQLRELPIAAVLVTDIARDGMLSGPNLDLARELGRASGAPAILSGGVSSLDDLALAASASEIVAAIVGKALYDGRIDLTAALAVCGKEALGGESR